MSRTSSLAASVSRQTRSQKTETTSSALIGAGLLLAVALGLLMRGAFFKDGRLALTLAIGLITASVVSRREARARLTEALRPYRVPVCGLISWVVFRVSFARHDPLATVLLVVGASLAYGIAARLTREEAEVLDAGLAILGLILVCTAWSGVVFHYAPWAIASSGVWRASTPLTYPNAAGAALTVLFLFNNALANKSTRADRTASYFLATGVALSMSRGAIAALALGLVVMLALEKRGYTSALKLIGAVVVAFAGSVPAAVGAASIWKVLLSAAALGCGACLVNWDRPIAVLACSAIATLAFGASMLGAGYGPLTHGASPRLALSSPDRVGNLRAGLELFEEHPVGGNGADNVWVSWTDARGRSRGTSYLHNEFLQFTVEFGLVGLCLLLWLLWALFQGGLELVQPWRAVWMSIFFSLLAHSTVDFLWHIPGLIVLTAVVLGRIAGLSRRDNRSNRTSPVCFSPGGPGASPKRTLITSM